MAMEQHIQTAKHVGNVVSIGTLVGWAIQWLPPVATLFSIVWTGLMIYESRTVQAWLAKRKK